MQPTSPNLLIQMLLGQAPPKWKLPQNNFDTMIVPPFGQPPDRNSILPNWVVPYRQDPSAWSEKP